MTTDGNEASSSAVAVGGRDNLVRRQTRKGRDSI